MKLIYQKEPVLVIGNGRMPYSICVCLLMAGHPVTLFTQNKIKAGNDIDLHFADLAKLGSAAGGAKGLEITDKLSQHLSYKLVIAATAENVAEKQTFIRRLEKKLDPDSLIAINTETISLEALQQHTVNPARIIGLNWVEPAHTTYFLEVIAGTGNTTLVYAEDLSQLAAACWKKDPYIIHGNYSIRAKLLAAMAREAFYLVENGYASIQDIDRACRNDAGYYLPFAGNCRYMDLMGTYAYGMVMKDLNRELSKDDLIPDLLKERIAIGRLGMENNKGFYEYEDGDVEKWDKTFRAFSYQIQEIISKYPFNYSKREV